MNEIKTNRRSFFKASALGALGTLTAPSLLTGCAGVGSKDVPLREIIVPEILEIAPDGIPLKAGLVGCGGRGTGAALNFLDAGNGLQVTALGDVFEDRLLTCREALKKNGHTIDDKNCFTGFDCYKKVIDSGVDIVLLCTPPIFRPEHFDYAINKGKHCFIEKPCAVDPVGARQVIATGKKAKQQGLSVISGIAGRSAKNNIETYKRVAGGAIGDLVSAHVSRMGGSLWFRERQPGWSDMEYMLRNWVNFCRTSGDFIVEMFIHQIDRMSWFIGDIPPTRAEATGGRLRRVTGDQHDFISVEYVYGDGNLRAHCTCRQINKCDNQSIVMLYGTKGYTNCSNTIYNYDGSIKWEYPLPPRDHPDYKKMVPDPSVQEHIRYITAIRTGKAVNDTDQHALSTLMAIMGREAAYTGKFITWEQIMSSNQKLSFDSYAFGPIPGFNEEVPLAGAPPI